MHKLTADNVQSLISTLKLMTSEVRTNVAMEDGFVLKLNLTMDSMTTTCIVNLMTISLNIYNLSF
jgi:hypothetical protein